MVQESAGWGPKTHVARRLMTKVVKRNEALMSYGARPPTRGGLVRKTSDWGPPLRFPFVHAKQ